MAIVHSMQIAQAEAVPPVQLSPLFNYYVARGNPGVLDFLSLSNGLAAVARFGICPLSLHDHPLTEAGARIRPSDTAFAIATERRLPYDSVNRRWTYHNVPAGMGVSGWEAAISANMAVLFGFWITSSYEDIPGNHNVHPDPARVTTDAGHAVVAIGFDRSTRHFLVKDSRGQGFADRGHWRMPYELVESELIVEAWVVQTLSL
jgi:hypothetical protein